MIVSQEQALKELENSNGLFLELFKHGSLVLEVYKPKKKDLQQPHSRDEVYIIISGQGTFFLHGTRSTCKTGDFIFVPAGAVHRFEDFSEDFATWVMFYGPEGGEKEIT